MQNLPTKFQLICPNVFREDLIKMANHKQELHMEAILLLVVRSTHNMEICAGSPILLSYKATIHCTSKIQRRFLKIEAPRVKICKINQPEKRIAYIWWPCLLIHILPTKFHFIWLIYKVLNNSLQVLLGKVI